LFVFHVKVGRLAVIGLIGGLVLVPETGHDGNAVSATVGRVRDGGAVRKELEDGEVYSGICFVYVEVSGYVGFSAKLHRISMEARRECNLGCSATYVVRWIRCSLYGVDTYAHAPREA